MKTSRPWVLAFAILGCASDRAQTVTLAAQPAGSAPPVASATTQVPPGPPLKNACLMLYECGCNAGCTEVDHLVDTLRPGMSVGAVSGPVKGQRVYVAQSRTEGGDRILTVQRDDPSSAIHVCAASARGPLVGYLCSTKDSGGARACTTCE